MEHTHTIKAIAPTVYQFNALRRFHLANINKDFSGNYYAWRDFYTLEDAKRHLISIAEDYYEDSLELMEIVNFVHTNGSLTIDGVTANIIELD